MWQHLRAIMFRFTTHCLLLLTVVTSQVLSGVSCCCLARSLTTTQRQVEFAAPDAATIPRCPKCAASRVPVSAAKSESCHGQSQSGDVRSHGKGCSCNKAPLIASQTDDLLLPSVGLISWIGAMPTAYLSCVEFLRVNRYELPSRFGGEAWQSIACVWRN